MKKKILLIIFSVVLIGAIAWCANTPYREVNLNENIQRIKNLNTCFSVHELYKEKPWDTMIVVKPYDSRTASDEKIDMGYAGDM